MSQSMPTLSPRRVLQFALDPFTGMMDAYRAHGSVVGVGYGSQRTTFVFGPEANAFVFANPSLFSWRDSFEVMLPVLGDTALLVTDGPDHHRRRHLTLPAFHRRRIDAYVRLMARNTAAAVETWQSGRRLDLYQALRSVIRCNTVEALYGARLAADNQMIGARLQIALDSTDLPLGMQLFLAGIPNPMTARARRARRQVAARVQAEIGRRRAREAGAARAGGCPVDGGEGGDGLAMLLAARDSEGRSLADRELEDQVISLIVAGYETTSAAMGWTVHAALSTPGVWDDARKEVDSVLGDAELTGEALERLPYVDAVVQEALRLHPPVVVLPRVAAQDFEFAGHTIRAGRRLAISPYVTHRMPEVWPQAAQFLPERWSPGHPAHRPATPSTYLPFGGGAHRCIGSPFATAELKTILIELLRRTELRLEAEATPASIMAMRPRRGVPVVVRRRT
ncbi:cytochrome P450 [Streptomyces sp. NPDC051907]|uniref:cytochrome P450 n=1 Tax=Streptomyces sp. NPDC051907 TaxID=3155284 RepID=UPI00343C12E5